MALRTTVIVGLYVVIFSLLDWLTRVFQILPGVVAWYPPDGVSFAHPEGLPRRRENVRAVATVPFAAVVAVESRR